MNCIVITSKIKSSFIIKFTNLSMSGGELFSKIRERSGTNPFTEKGLIDFQNI
jgi:hypothetical protein